MTSTETGAQTLRQIDPLRPPAASPLQVALPGGELPLYVETDGSYQEGGLHQQQEVVHDGRELHQ